MNLAARSEDTSASTWLDSYRQLESVLPGHTVLWLTHLRQEAIEHFVESGLPNTRQEDWKYTDVRAIAKRNFRQADSAVPLAASAMQPFIRADFGVHRLVFVDGHYRPEFSSIQSLPPGVSVSNLGAVMAGDPDALQEHLGRHADMNTNGFAALNTAFMRDGAYVRVQQGVAVAEPIHLLFVASGTTDTVAQVRNLVVAEPNSQVVLIENYVSLGDAAYLTNAVTEISAGANASVEHYKLERESDQAFHVAGTHVRQARDSMYTSHNIAIGGRLVRNDLKAILDGEGIECTLNGLYLTGGRQHVDNHTRVEHRKPHSTSHELYKGVLDGHSRGVFSGRVIVHQDAQKTDAEQANNNLLLSRNAEADSLPQLEIYADDVKCSHGSTVGELDETALFYLRSRAIEQGLARSILVYAFASDVLQRMRLDSVRAELENALTAKLLPGQSLR